MIVFTKQNRVIKQLEAERQKCKREARLESKPVPIIKDTVAEQKNKINNNIAAKPETKPAAQVKPSVPAAAVKAAPAPVAESEEKVVNSIPVSSEPAQG